VNRISPHRNRLPKGDLANPPPGMYRAIVKSREGQIHVKDGNLGQACEAVILSFQRVGVPGVVVSHHGEVMWKEPQ